MHRWSLNWIKIAMIRADPAGKNENNNNVCAKRNAHPLLAGSKHAHTCLWQKKKSTRRLMHRVGAVSCKGGNSPFGQIRQLSSQQTRGGRVGRAAWLLTCCKVLIQRWTSVGPMESTRGARSVHWRLSTPASTHHSTRCLVSKLTHSLTHTHRIRSDHHIQNWGDSLPGVFAHRKTLHSLLWWICKRASWAQCATGRCSRLICANQSRLCWATSPCDPDWLTQGCN